MLYKLCKYKMLRYRIVEKVDSFRNERKTSETCDRLRDYKGNFAQLKNSIINGGIGEREKKACKKWI